MARRRLIVALGSPHGDDAVAWHVARALPARGIPAGELREAASPARVLDWLADLDELHVVDACRADGPVGRLHCWSWPVSPPDLSRARWTSHGLSPLDALRLAATLGALPPHVTIWGIEIDSPLPGEALSPALQRQLPTVVDQLANHLTHKTSISPTPS
jgi:hydrogenase maturation protease